MQIAALYNFPVKKLPIFFCFGLLLQGFQSLIGREPPQEWIDAATGHRIIRLSRDPGTRVLYFNQNCYTESGDKIILTKGNKILVVDLKTREIATLDTGIAQHIAVGRKSRQVYYTCDGVVYSTHIDTGITREVAKLGTITHILSGLTINADETLLAGSYELQNSDSNLDDYSETKFTISRNSKGHSAVTKQFDWNARLSAKIPMRLFTINISTGEANTFYPSTDMLNHVQFSPSDPQLLMFCHDGPWQLVDRIWTIRTDGSQLKKIHTRTMELEIAGHEFFSHDGQIIWYDLQTPKSEVFWLAGSKMTTGEMVKYSVKRENWSVHYGESPDGSLFAGDGGGRFSVAEKGKDGRFISFPVDGQWIFLFRPEEGSLRAERLVDLGDHDYRLEPNVTFTPDGKWIVFQSNMHGTVQVYAVEIQKAAQGGPDQVKASQ